MAAFRANASPRTIVVFNHHHLGDLIGSFPALLALRQQFPDAKIINVAPPLPLSLLRDSPLSDELISCPKSTRGMWSALWQVRKQRPDVAVCFSGTRRVAIMARLSGARRRLGFAPRKHDWGFNEKVVIEGPPATQHDLKLVEALGCQPTKRDTMGLLQTTDEEKRVAGEWLEKNGVAPGEVLVGFNLGASVARRQWGAERFAAVANAVRDLGAKVVVFGGPGDAALVASFEAKVQGPVLRAAGQFSPRGSAAVMEKCAVLVTGDTGPMHLSIAVGTPVVALFGIVPASYRLPPHSPHIGLEHNAPCQIPGQKAKCRYENDCSCLAAISPLEVVEAVRQKLALAN